MPTHSTKSNGKFYVPFAILLSLMIIHLLPSVAQAQLLGKEAVKDLEKKFFLAVQNADTTILSELLAKDYVETYGNPPKTREKADLLLSLSVAENRMIVNLKASAYEISSISMHGKTAVVHGQYNRISTDRSGRDTSSSGLFSNVWEKKRKGWQLVSSHRSSLPNEGLNTRRQSETEILAIMKTLHDAMIKNDHLRTAELIEDTYADDFLITSVAGTMLPKKSMLSNYEPVNWANLSITESLQVKDQQVRVYGDAAVVTCAWDWKSSKKDGTRTDRLLRVTHIFAKQNNQWKLVGMHGSNILPQEDIIAKD